MENIGDFGVRPWISKGQPLDAKVTVEMKGPVAKGAFLKKFRGHKHMHWKDFFNSTAGSCL